MFNFPFSLNEEIPAAVFGHLYQLTYNFIDYDGALSTGIIFHIISTGTIRNLIIELEYNGRIETFTLTGEYPANTEIVIDTREEFQTVTIGGVDRTADVNHRLVPMSFFPLCFTPDEPGFIFAKGSSDFEGSQWLQLRPGTNKFTFYHDGTEKLNVMIEADQTDLFEVQA